MKNNQLAMSGKIQDKIFMIRNQQVMLDFDLAELYQVETRVLNQAVKRNKERFPNNFMFQLNSNEVESMVSQNVIPSKQHLGGHLPYVFTEQGVAMLSAVLRSKIAVKVSVQIINAFVEMRRFLALNARMFDRLENVEQKQIKTDKKVDEILNALEDKTLKPKQGIFYDGQIFDAYIFVADLIKGAKKSIILIDNYVDESVLQLFRKRKKKVKVTIYTKQLSRILKQDLEKYNQQYQDRSIKIKTFKKAHDRFMIIDNKNVYHIGASLKDLGKKWFAFSKLEIEISKIINKLN